VRYAPLFVLLVGCTGPTHPVPSASLAVSTSDCIECETGVVLHNEMSSVFRLVSAAVLIDGQPVFENADEARLASSPLIDVARGLPLRPGAHRLSLRLKFRGHGDGVFRYLDGYTFNVASSEELVARRGLVMHVHAYEKGGPTTPLEARPAVRFEARIE
jgi:hypothetical protein